jgi:hypothetical protein
MSAFRCLFPNEYEGNVVFHDTALSLAGRLALRFWEEIGEAIPVAANAAASAGLWSTRDALSDAGILLSNGLLFGLVYLPLEVPNPRLQIADERRSGETLGRATRLSWKGLGEGPRRAIRERNRTTDGTAWGGLVGLTWMTGYFATLLPIRAHRIVAASSRQGGAASTASRKIDLPHRTRSSPCRDPSPSTLPACASGDPDLRVRPRRPRRVLVRTRVLVRRRECAARARSRRRRATPTGRP